jgi:ABC-type antimicrobial peptide transport system permease subunit
MRTFIIIGSVIAVAVIVGAILAITSNQRSQRTTISEFAPKVNFIKFEPERQELRVRQNTSILFNVQNSEDRVINDSKVVVTLEPEVGKTYLSISNSTVDLPVLNTNGRTGEIKVTITATGTPAKEAVYVVRGTIFAEETKTDVREFQLTIRQQQ